MGRKRTQPLVGSRVRLRDWTGLHLVDVLDLNSARARFRLADGTEVTTTRSRFDAGLRRAGEPS